MKRSDVEMSAASISESPRRRLLRWWGWLLLTTLVLELLVASRYFAVVDLDAAPLSLLFRTAMLVSHFTVLTFALSSPVLILIALWPRPRLAIPAGVLWSAAILAALLIDTQVYQLYRFHINAGVLNLLFGGAAGETFIFSDAMYVQAAGAGLAIVLILTAAALLWWRYVQRIHGRQATRRTITAGVLIAAVGFHGTHIWADVVGYKPLLEQTDVLPVRYAATAKRQLRKLGVNVRSRTPLAGARDDGNSLAYPLQPLECQAPASPPNIIVILIDSWRFDALNAEVTPNIHSFAGRSAQFLDHYSGGNATRIGVFSLFYSIPGTYWHRVLAERRSPVLIEQLLAQDYDVRAFRSAPIYSPEFDRTVFAQVPEVRVRSDGAGPADWDRDLTRDFQSFLDSRPKQAPFFALLFYDSPHSFQFPDDYPPPFRPSGAEVNYFELHNAADPQEVLNRYRNSVHYVDSLVGEALAAIESEGLLENSIIVITGDHGQEFNDNRHNFWGHGSNFTRYQTGVPLVLYEPDVPPQVYRHRTTHFDVMPTLMREYLGCTAPFDTHSIGRPLLESGGRETLVMSEYADFAIVQPDLIAVVREHGMAVRDADYRELDDSRLPPDAIASALEQKSRFYKRGGTGSGSK